MSSKVYTVEGMTCDHCVRAVTAEVTAVAPDAQVVVELGEPSTLTIDGAELTDDQVAEALDEAGGYVLVTRG